MGLYRFRSIAPHRRRPINSLLALRAAKPYGSGLCDRPSPETIAYFSTFTPRQKAM